MLTVEVKTFPGDSRSISPIFSSVLGFSGAVSSQAAVERGFAALPDSPKRVLRQAVHSVDLAKNASVTVQRIHLFRVDGMNRPNAF